MEVLDISCAVTAKISFALHVANSVGNAFIKRNLTSREHLRTHKLTKINK